MAERDAIVAFCDEILDVERYPDYGPIGLQVEGCPQVEKVVAAVSASKELFELAASRGAQLLLVHHGIFWRNEPQIVDRRMKGRLQTLFAHDLTLAAYHLALDAHPEIGNAALLAKRLGATPERSFAVHGVGATLSEPISFSELEARVSELLDRQPLVYANGPQAIRSLAIVTGAGGRALLEAAHEGYDAFLTGEPEEPALRDSKELGIHFVAAGHHATERFGIEALGQRVAERFGVDCEFLDVPNPV